MRTYDIQNAGPKNRFMANGRIVSNSGSIVQLQNLFRNSLLDLEEARSLVKAGDYDALSMLYESVPEVLAQCVRTAFIPAEGMKFIVADFSAIEARVLSWVAGEKWRMEAFRDGKDIYCETASRMFHVKVEKHGENAEYRQRGKQAELSCIAEGQLVLTDNGLIPIEGVTAEMRVWDGCEWVNHAGVIYKGEREVIEYDGLAATPDHLVYADGIFRRFGSLAKRIERVRRSRVYDVLNAGRHHCFTVSGKLVHNCGYGGSVGALRAMGALEAGMKEEELQPLVEAWRKANPRIVKLWADVEEAAKTAVKEKTTVKTHGLVFVYRGGMLYIRLPSGRNLSYVKPRMGENRYGGECLTYMGNDFTRHWARILTFGGKLVENLTQGISRDLLCHALEQLRDMRIVAHVHDELIIECPQDTSVEEVCGKMSRVPEWAEGLILRADGYECKYYRKD